jgi:hypothetical protein
MAGEKSGTPRVNLPKQLEELIEQTVERMSEQELREFEAEAEKVMEDYARRSGTQDSSRKTP